MLSALKNFGVTFLIAALLFGMLAYLATGFVTSTMNSIMSAEEDELSEIMQNEDNQNLVNAETETPQTQNPTNEKIPEGESFNFLVITTDYRPDLYDNYKPTLDHMYKTDWYSVSASDTRGCLSGDYREPGVSAIVLVRADKEARQYTYTYFSPETQVYTTTGYHTLSEVYAHYGRQTLADHVHAMTGMKIRYTFLLNAYNLDEFTEICGTPTVTLTKDIYQNADLMYTTQFETTKEHIGTDGYPWTEHIPNTLVLPAGEIELNAANFDILNSVSELNSADVAAKEAWSVEIVRAFLNSVASREDLKTLLAQLITNKSEWGNIEGLNYTEPEPEGTGSPEELPAVPGDGETVTAPEAPSEDEPYNPWEDTGGDMSGDVTAEEVPSETEPEPAETKEEETIDRIWLSGLSEPEGPILETNYTMNDFDGVREMISAVTYFENVSVSYPGKFMEANEDRDAFFDPDLQAGLKKFRQYRK